MTRAQVHASSYVVRRVSAQRRAAGLSAQQLAERCAALGMPELSRSVIANLESGRRRTVSVDEVFCFAAALKVSPLELLPV